jgi:hypothetical protein
MQRSKNTDGGRKPQPVGNLLAGMMIGSAIMTMATGAAMLGATWGVTEASLKGS